MVALRELSLIESGDEDMGALLTLSHLSDKLERADGLTVFTILLWSYTAVVWIGVVAATLTDDPFPQEAYMALIGPMACLF